MAKVFGESGKEEEEEEFVCKKRGSSRKNTNEKKATKDAETKEKMMKSCRKKSRR